MASSPGWMTSSRPVVGVLLQVVVQFAVAPLWIALASTEQLEAAGSAVCGLGAVGPRHGRDKSGRTRLERGSSPRRK